jgi:hypothetical protein
MLQNLQPVGFRTTKFKVISSAQNTTHIHSYTDILLKLLVSPQFTINICYMHSEDIDDDSGVLLTDTYTKHCLSSDIWYTGPHCCIQQLSIALSCQSVYSIYIAHSPCHPHTWQSSSGSDKGQLSDDATTKHSV